MQQQASLCRTFASSPIRGEIRKRRYIAYADVSPCLQRKVASYSFILMKTLASIAVNPPVVIPEENILRIVSGN